jgi:hypothetical protein
MTVAELNNSAVRKMSKEMTVAELKRMEMNVAELNTALLFSEQQCSKKAKLSYEEAGTVLETLLTDVFAFLELSGTVQANNHQQEHPDSKNIRTESEPAEVFCDMEPKLT